MPARKNPFGPKQKHYTAKEIAEEFGISLSKAYEIIHQCVAYGEVMKLGGSIRVSETALSKWYDAHRLDKDENSEEYRNAILKVEEAYNPKGKPGRPRKEAAYVV